MESIPAQLRLPFVGLEEVENLVGLAKLDDASERVGPFGIQDGRLVAILRVDMVSSSDFCGGGEAIGSVGTAQWLCAKTAGGPWAETAEAYMQDRMTLHHVSYVVALGQSDAHCVHHGLTRMNSKKDGPKNEHELASDK